MKTIVNSIPGYRAFEYLLILSPHEELANRIQRIKDRFAEEYKTDFAKRGRPQIALATFYQYEMMEERIVNRMKNIAMGFPPFKVELKDFGSFPTHSIYINVTSRLPIQKLVKQLRSETQRLMKLDDDRKPHFLMEPYISIGRKLLPWQYEKGWLEYSHSHFTGKFIADSMKLLRRPAGEMKYHHAHSFEFQNLPVVTKQGELW